jgi:FdhD protein
MAPVLKHVEIVRVRDGVRATETDRAAAEEPLEVRLHGRPFAVIMRTPGADRELAAGFLLAERVLRSADDLGTIEHCRDGSAGTETAENVINVTLSGRSADDLGRLLAGRRETMSNSSCGLCGRLTIESLKSDVAAVPPGGRVTSAFVSALPGRLRAAQAVFDDTGGLHAAGLFAPDGDLVATAEDVGRHNAVDKIVGRLLMQDALPLAGHTLCVSGRTSFEIVQKALFAGIPIVASVSAPSSLAIELAREAGITLVGFVRGQGFNIYTHAGRIG